MKKVISAFIFLFLLWLSNYSYALSLTAQVDRTYLSLEETLTLTVTLDKQNANPINFNELQIQFDILRQQRSSQTQIINGRIDAKTSWTLILAPKEHGTLVIPSFKTEGVFSEPISITVNKTSSSHSQSSTHSQTQGQNNHKEVWLEASINKDSAYVQEQLIYTLRLYYRITLSGYRDDPINIDNTAVEFLNEKTYQKKLKGITYNVLEKTYAIYPQVSGTLVIPEQQWQLERPTRSFGFGNSSTPFRRVSSEPKLLDIKAIPSQSTASHWLPSPAIALSQQWQQSIITAKVGEPVTYTLTLKADGLQYSQLPDINIDSNEYFTVYADQPETQNITSATGIIGSKTSHYAIIPKQTGRHALPAVTLTWWNITTDQEETLTLQPQTLTVAKTELSQQALPSELVSPASGEITQHIDSNTQTHHFWQWLSLLLGVSLLACIALWIYQRSLYLTLLDNKQASQQNHHENKENKVANLTATYKLIENAIQEQQWLRLRQHLLQWASLKTELPINSTDEINHYFPSLEIAINTLDKQLYSHNHTVVWNYQELIPLLKKQTFKKSKAIKNKLQPLYPE